MYTVTGVDKDGTKRVLAWSLDLTYAEREAELAARSHSPVLYHSTTAREERYITTRIVAMHVYRLLLDVADSCKQRPLYIELAGRNF